MNIYGKILNYKRFAVHDGNGIRTTLFLKGCPLSCLWCHNPEGIGFAPQTAYLPHKCIGCGACADVCRNGAHRITEEGHIFDRTRCTACGQCEEACLGGALAYYGKTVSAQEAAEVLLRDKAFFLQSGGGVTLSGGEPLMQPRFCAEIFRLVHENGVSTALDTCGYADEHALDTVLAHTDCVLYDIKAFDEETHISLTGKSNRRILENLAVINERGIPTEIRIPLVPGANDTEIDAIGAFLSRFPVITAVRVLPYHAYSETKYQSLGMVYGGTRFRAPTAEEIRRAADALTRHGLSVILPD